MKHHYQKVRWIASALVGLALCVCTGTSLAATDLVLGTFDSDVAGWGTAWGNATAAHDPMQDNTGNGGGACYIAAEFSADQNTLTLYGCVEGNPWSHPTSANFNLSDYKSLEFDIKWDTSSSVSIADFNTPPLGGEGGIYLWAVDYPGFSIRPTLGNVQVPAAAATGWAHLSVPLDPAISGIDPSKGIVLKKWITEAQKNAGGNYGFWVDNVILKGSDAPPPPPTLSLETPTPGLAFIAASGGQWDRQNIRTVGEDYSWVGAPGTVSYSLTVADYAAMAGFQLHMFFVPGTPDPARSDPDWHEPNVLAWTIGGNADGSAYSSVHYKTNAPDDNGILYSDGDLGGAGSIAPTGTWTILFNQDTNITTISPTGETNSAALPPEVAPVFGGIMKIYIGIVPGDPARVGQMAVLSNVKFSGLPNNAGTDSNFLGKSLDTNVWEIIATSSLGVQEIPTDAAYWVDWTLPALDFALEGAPAVTGPWRSLAPTGFDVGAKHRVLLRTSDLPAADAGFWRLIKRSFTKLQVLLPGETAAPCTATGKTGTPSAQTAGVEFDVMVNAVDDNWNLTTGGRDNVRLSSTDEGAFLPGDTAMVRGTATIKVTLNTPGTWTITATDVTDGSKTANTSSPVTVE